MTSDVIKAAAVVLEDCVREAVLDLVASCDTIVELEALIEAAEVVQVVYFQIISSAIVILKNFEMKTLLSSNVCCVLNTRWHISTTPNTTKKILYTVSLWLENSTFSSKLIFFPRFVRQIKVTILDGCIMYYIV